MVLVEVAQQDRGAVRGHGVHARIDEDPLEGGSAAGAAVAIELVLVVHVVVNDGSVALLKFWRTSTAIASASSTRS